MFLNMKWLMINNEKKGKLHAICNNSHGKLKKLDRIKVFLNKRKRNSIEAVKTFAKPVVLTLSWSNIYVLLYCQILCLKK